MKILLYGFTLALATFAADIKRPNVVFIFSDDINKDSLGVYGNPDCKTPNIDRLAAAGMRFEHTYCATAMCGPFRHELYSGRSPWRTLTLSNHTTAEKNTLGIGDYLIKEGYDVVVNGKGHSVESYSWSKIPRDRGPKTAELEGLQSYAQAAVNVFKHSKANNKPFCLFLASHDGHSPHNTGDPSQYDAAKLTVPPYHVDTPELRAAMVPYYAEVTHFDALVGQVWKKLEEMDLADNTLLMVCTEQGNTFPFAKWTNYVHGTNTALIAHWPGVIKPGTVCDELVAVADMVPTFADAAGVKLEAGTVDGKSILPMLKGKPHVNHEYVYNGFSNLRIAQARELRFPIRTIRNREYSLFFNPNHQGFTANYTNAKAYLMIKGEEEIPTDPKRITPVVSWVKKHSDAPMDHPLIAKVNHRPEYEFYNLKNDPHEIDNQISNPEYAAVIDKMKKQLHQRLAALGDADPMATDMRIIEKLAVAQQAKIDSGFFEQRAARKAMMKTKRAASPSHPAGTVEK